LVALCVTAGGAFQARGQNVSLGASSFSSTSDQVAPDWYWPLPSAERNVYHGYGIFAGATRIETYLRGQSIAGVKAVQWHLETINPGAVTPVAEDWWLAFNVAGDLCVLQVVQGGRNVYVASPQVTPPVMIPAKPVRGQKWDVLGLAFTVEDVANSLHAGGFLKLGIGAPGQPVEYKTYDGGVGVIQDAVSAAPRPIGSGWTLHAIETQVNGH
jgi:hypothetical protein